MPTVRGKHTTTRRTLSCRMGMGFSMIGLPLGLVNMLRRQERRNRMFSLVGDRV
ncbi:hypothetical protein QC761_0091400 [Podospora bellae-mahoneyi]|uniref:Uncharacterized protein n=1 Tax=Podospora bellae-mahoneyi TaxID=2093777 RepID=A0ABR0F8S7_9PEZI|nr:hypothetical protein QC761_0091400 [Podospora bellae-mahoneyi]